MNPWKFLGVKKLHSYLCIEFDIYREWHWHPHHQKVHWSIVCINAVIFMLVLTLSLVPFFSNKTSADAPALTVSPAGYTNIDNFTFTLNNGPVSGAAKYQYRTGGDTPGVWVDFNPPLSTTVTIGPSNENHPSGAYVEGENTFFFRALDGGDALVPGSELQKQYYYNITPPGPPNNIEAIPETSTVNSFGFSWEPPSLYFGDVNQIKYYFSVNAYPTSTNVTEVTGLSLSAGPYATLAGENTMFFVSKDEAGNIEYGSRNEATFYANTTAPPIPTGLQIDDISSKDADQYRLAVSWLAPTFPDPGNFKGYDVYSATSESGPFTKVATTTETSYVQTGLTKDVHYYYYIKSTDKTGNESVASTTVDKIATGRYTRPPNVTKNPEVSAKSKTATINWVTERQANSTIEFGKTSGLGQSTGNSQTTYVTDHTVALTNLEPATTYYYKAVFLDPDGNLGETSVGTFVTASASTVSNLKIEDIGTSQMTISWETNSAAYGEVLYGKTSSFGSSLKEDGFYTKKHMVKLSGLESGTLYHVQVKEKDEEEGTFYSDEYKQETLPVPTVSGLKTQPKTEVETPTVTVEYETNVDTTTIVRYTPENGKTLEYVSMDFTKKHSAEISGLVGMKLYNLEVTGRDRFGNDAAIQKSTITTLSDTMPPKVQKISEKKKVSGEGGHAEAELTVKMTTNEPSTAIIEATKGISGSEYNIISNEDALNTEHTIVIKLGDPGLPYTYRLKLMDSQGNETTTPVKTIVVSRAKKGALDYVADVFAKSFGWLTKFIQ